MYILLPVTMYIAQSRLWLEESLLVIDRGQQDCCLPPEQSLTFCFWLLFFFSLSSFLTTSTCYFFAAVRHVVFSFLHAKLQTKDWGPLQNH